MENRVTTRTSVTIYNGTAERFIDEIGRCPGAKELDLNATTWRTSETLHRLVDAILTLTDLRYLRFTDNDFSRESTNEVFQRLGAISLEILSLYRLRLPKAFSFASFVGVSKLDIQVTRLPNDSVLLELADLPLLVRLDMVNLGVSDTVYIRFLHKLETNTTLKELNITEDDCLFDHRHITKLFYTNTTLVLVKLHTHARSVLGLVNTSMLIPAVRTHPTIQKFTYPKPGAGWLTSELEELKTHNARLKATTFTNLLISLKK